ncbi:MAG: hypothetical protein Q9209_001295 [Squamulea sp. 1 TL-2023]
MSGEDTKATGKKGKAGTIVAGDQVKFLISCIRHGVNGKIDWEEVANECSIVTKAAAAKRYERLLKANDVSPQTPRNSKDASIASSKRKTGTAKEAKPTTKKRKATESDIAVNHEEDDEPTTAGKKKKFKEDSETEDVVVKSEKDKEDSPEASTIPQYDGSINVAPTVATKFGHQSMDYPVVIGDLSPLDHFLAFQRGPIPYELPGRNDEENKTYVD